MPTNGHPVVLDVDGEVLEKGCWVEWADLRGKVLAFPVEAGPNGFQRCVEVSWGDCPNCDDGVVIEAEPECCGNTTSSGECRGDCVVPRPVEAQCPTCGGAGEITECFALCPEPNTLRSYRCPDLQKIKREGDALDG